MGIPVKTVEKQIGRALQVLRNELKEEKLVSIVILVLSMFPFF